MKFFTREWAEGDLSDEETKALPAAYQKHLSTLLARMPATVRALAHGVNIHDGRLRAVVLDRAHRRLTLAMRCGDRQMGYFDLELVYDGVILGDVDHCALRDVSRHADAEALYDEVDGIDDGRWLHRILFSRQREICVSFERLAMHLEPKPNREFSRPEDVYAELPADAV